MKQKRRKVQRAYLERRLYKTERRIERFNQEALMLRQAIDIMEEQDLKKRQASEEEINKALHATAIDSVPATKGEKDASNI